MRRNVVTFLIGLCLFFAIGHILPDFKNIIHDFGWAKGFLLFCIIVLCDVILPYNIVLYLTEGKRFSNTNFIKQQVLIFCGIVLPSIIVNGFLNYLINGSTKYLKYSIVWSFYLGGLGAVIYLFIRHYDAEKKKKLFDKELELSRLSELKTKAELDALHSKINPHFLYNALNSIADLTITDGKKARQMTISLAGLFRHSMNYTNSNYSTVEEELETATLYLEIEKARFEEKLEYTIDANPDTLLFLVPKFILQPIIENAVKHGLKKTNEVTKIRVQVFMENENLIINVYDNGPSFPFEINPGYGLKSMYDKLELLFPGQFEVNMVNKPEKFLSICLNNPIKNEATSKGHTN